jgi:uncharacterized surface protein with fasciclin (FAS1) repeats
MKRIVTVFGLPAAPVLTASAAGPFTVFEPAGEACAKLPAGAVEGLLLDTAELKKFLLYHVVSGKVEVDGANVVKTGIGCDDGVIHGIDAGIMPRRQAEVRCAVAGRPRGTTPGPSTFYIRETQSRWRASYHQVLAGEFPNL